MVGARRRARPRLPDSESGGSAIPREPRADEIGVPDRLRSGDLLHERPECLAGMPALRLLLVTPWVQALCKNWGQG